MSIAQARMTTLWQTAADLTLAPAVGGFGYDSFDRAPQLIASGESAARAALPTLRQWLHPEPLVSSPAANLGPLAGKPHAA